MKSRRRDLVRQVLARRESNQRRSVWINMEKLLEGVFTNISCPSAQNER